MVVHVTEYVFATHIHAWCNAFESEKLDDHYYQNKQGKWCLSYDNAFGHVIGDSRRH